MVIAQYQAKNTVSRCVSTIRRTNGAVICFKYDIGLKRAAASTFLAISGWVRAAKDIIVPCKHR